ncbi:flp pilus-assembly TadE/G-like family protein [Jatrophihabitans telluris]|uniref:Flp pilus-assembly TadE/G-like family protein n=1 Tax=Jatrophihabitans telluris TaxID=2038343 RepID=A0ABY4QZ02_9ACTN|nr:Rv3654c family TadE-like protein [Jatrophihabitans telluris]UQX88140.1 flp pilus-assembly TadE/G-like family protein [Jatrophihabitans telluris]
MRPRRRQPSGCDDGSDSGSASLYLLGLAALVIGLAAIVAVQAGAIRAKHFAEASADLAALSGAQQIGRAGDPCVQASQVARANGAALTNCSVQLDPGTRTGWVRVEVSVTVRLPGLGVGTARARARAGRLPATRPVMAISPGRGLARPPTAQGRAP